MRGFDSGWYYCPYIPLCVSKCLYWDRPWVDRLFSWPWKPWIKNECFNFLVEVKKNE